MDKTNENLLNSHERGTWRIFTPQRPTSNRINTVIIFGWTDGTLYHISKYIPFWIQKNLTVLVVLSEMKRLLQGEARLSQLMQPIIPTLEDLGLLRETNSTGEVLHSCLIHLFSNGGCIGLYSLTQTLLPRKLSVEKAIFDSCPGKPGRIFTFPNLHDLRSWKRHCITSGTRCCHRHHHGLQDKISLFEANTMVYCLHTHGHHQNFAPLIH